MRFLFTPQPNHRSTKIGRPREASDELLRAPIFSEVPALALATLFSDSSPSFEHVHEEVKIWNSTIEKFQNQYNFFPARSYAYLSPGYPCQHIVPLNDKMATEIDLLCTFAY